MNSDALCRKITQNWFVGKVSKIGCFDLSPCWTLHEHVASCLPEMQASEPDVVLPSTCAACRVVVVGDHKQLGQTFFCSVFNFQAVIRQDKKKAKRLLSSVFRASWVYIKLCWRERILCRTRGAWTKSMLSLRECLGDAVLGKDDEESAAIAFKHDVELAVALPDIMLQVKFVQLLCKFGLCTLLGRLLTWSENIEKLSLSDWVYCIRTICTWSSLLLPADVLR